MDLKALFGIGIGLFGIWVAVQAIATGSVTFVFARRFHGWGPTLSAEFDREDRPVGFWASTLVYGLGGLLLLVAAGRRLAG